MSKTILIVDDEAPLRYLIEQSLEELEEENGCEIITASDGLEGLEKAKELLPDLIFLDVMMPKMNGFEVCETIKKEISTKVIPVIMLTAKGQELDHKMGIESGADQYLTKPFDPDHLLEVAKKLLSI